MWPFLKAALVTAGLFAAAIFLFFTLWTMLSFVIALIAIH